MQNYKVYYKSKKIVFYYFENFCKYNKKNNKSIHSLINPEINQLISAMDECFLNNNNIMQLNVFVNNPPDYFEIFIENLKHIFASGGGVINKDNELIFIRKNNIWDLPKGKIEFNEEIESAAIREVKEETGLKNVNILKQLPPSYHVYKENSTWIFKTTYWFLMNCKKSKLYPQSEEGITDVVWFKKDKIDEIKKQSYPSLREVINKIKKEII